MLVTPSLAAAATQVATTEVAGLDVVTVTDDGSDGEIQVTRGVESGTMEPFVAVESAGGATPGVGCKPITLELVVCGGTFDAVAVFGNGGADEISMRLILDGQPPLLGQALGGTGNDTLRTPVDNRDVPQPEIFLSGDLGDDTVEGGNGVDDLRGGEGNDTVRGFGGSDFAFGEEGDDLIFMRDGASELVDCGTGSDTAEVDPADAVDASCESVDDGLASPAVPATSPAPIPVLPLGFGAVTGVTLKLAARRIPAAGLLRVRVTNANGFAVSGELSGKGITPRARRSRPPPRANRRAG